MKPCMSHYSHKSIPDAKVESSNFSIFRDRSLIIVRGGSEVSGAGSCILQ